MDSKTTASKQVLREAITLFDSDKDVARTQIARLLLARMNDPHATITVVGETSSGKSTLINAMLGREVLPTAASPSTATVTHVVCRPEVEDRFFAIYRGATQDSVSSEEFRSLALQPSEDLLRIQVRARPTDLTFLNLHVFDTPGYNSILIEHEEVLRAFLPESDAIVFVAGYRSGFGQNEQDLLEVINNAIGADPTIPVVLAINRVPKGCNRDDKRVQEILSNARDCLKIDPKCVLVESMPVDQREAGHPCLPQADHLWKLVHDLVSHRSIQDAVERRMDTLLIDLLTNALRETEREQSQWSNGDWRRDDTALKSLRDARDRSLDAVTQTEARLRQMLPSVCAAGAMKLRHEVAQTIECSDKWFGAEDCSNWISCNELPVGVRKLGKEIEFQIHRELDLLDRELNEIAITAVQRVRSEVQLSSDAAVKFIENITFSILERVGGSVITSLLQSFGGVGGAAAGAGNVVKMMISRGGEFFGKTFSRAIYDQIGKTFTKEMLKKLSIAVQIVIDLAIFLRGVATWQKKLIKKTSEALADWEKQTLEDLLEKHIPEIKQRNIQYVRSIYDDLIDNEQTSLLSDQNQRREKVDKLKHRHNRLQCLLSQISDTR